MQEQKTEIVQYLVMEYGHDVNLKNMNGKTPFYVASMVLLIEASNLKYNYTQVYHNSVAVGKIR